ncbi:hypothetical protein E2C01_005264 [Portunus trituberculatus]|uniref:Uncharacterized protein n=1 Tax=Portunus trituberculatus TaxID=210409 RepID=A0A5B7CV32_PORTR|nr:hypothetical protein [Portunus trituberculatus]
MCKTNKYRSSFHASRLSSSLSFSQRILFISLFLVSLTWKDVRESIGKESDKDGTEESAGSSLPFILTSRCGSEAERSTCPQIDMPQPNLQEPFS